MKKMLIVIFIFFVLISSVDFNKEFTLIDYFDGVYACYTEKEVNEHSINLGFCYMQNSSKKGIKIIGESVKVVNLEVGAAIKKLKAKVIKTECLEDGMVVIYAYSNLIDNRVQMGEDFVNLQIAHNDNCSVIGWPLILGSF